MSEELKFLDVTCDHRIADEQLSVSSQTRQAPLKTLSTKNAVRLFQGENEVSNIDSQGNFRQKWLLVDEKTIQINDLETVDIEGALREPVAVTIPRQRTTGGYPIDSLETSEDATIVRVGLTSSSDEYQIGRDFLVDASRVLDTSEFLTLDLTGALQRLRHINVSSVIVKDLSLAITYAANVDYEIDANEGTILWLSNGSIAPLDTVLVSYTYLGGTVVNESVTFLGADAFIQLSKIRLVSGTLEVRDGTRTTIFVPDVDYSIDYFTGQLTILTSGAIPLETQLAVAYRYTDLKLSSERVIRSSEKIDFLANTGAIELLKVGYSFSQDFFSTFKRLAFFPDGDSQKLHYTDFDEISVFGLEEQMRTENITFNASSNSDQRPLAHSDIFTLAVYNLTRDKQYIEGEDYSLDSENGVLSRITSGTITSEQRVSTAYSYTVTGSVEFTDYAQTVFLPDEAFLELNSLVVSGGGFTLTNDYTIDYATGALSQVFTGSIPLSTSIPVEYRVRVVEEEISFGFGGDVQFLTSPCVLDFRAENDTRLEDFVEKRDFILNPLQGRIQRTTTGNINVSDTIVVTYSYPATRELEEIVFTDLPGGNTVKLLRDVIFEFEMSGFVEGQDYTLNRRNGTVSRLAYGRIALNDSVYLTYSYSRVFDLDKDYTYSKTTEFLARVPTGRIRAGDIVRIGYLRKDLEKTISEDFIIAKSQNDYTGDVYVTLPAISDTQSVNVSYMSDSQSFSQVVFFSVRNLSQQLYHRDLVQGSVVVTNQAGTICYLENVDYVIDYINGVITRETNGRLRWLSQADQSLAHQKVSSVVVRDLTEAITYIEGTDYVVDYQTGIVSLVDGTTILSTQTVKVSYEYSVEEAGQFTSPLVTINLGQSPLVTSSLVLLGFSPGVDYSVGTSSFTRLGIALPLNRTISYSYRVSVSNELITFNVGTNVPTQGIVYYVELLFRNFNAIRWLTNAVSTIHAPSSSYWVTYTVQPLRIVAIDTSILVADSLRFFIEQVGDSKETQPGEDLSPTVGKFFIQGDETNLTGLIGKEKGFLNSRNPILEVPGLMIMFEKTNYRYTDNSGIERYVYSRGVDSTVFTYPRYSVDYICQTNYCLKCVGLEILNDLSKDTLGRYRLIQKSQKLEQDVLKVIRDALGSNTYRPDWGSTVETLIGRSFPDDVVRSLIRETVLNALNLLRNLQIAQASTEIPNTTIQFVTQQVTLSNGSTVTRAIEVVPTRYQTLTPEERIQAINSVIVNRDENEPTQWNIEVIILTAAQRPLAIETGITT